jgi:hypothetical protein
LGVKETEYYRRAFEDGAFRRAQLDDLKYFKEVDVGLLVVAGFGFVAHTLYFGFVEKTWDSGWGWLVILAISAAGSFAHSTRIGALEAIEEKCAANKSANPSCEPTRLFPSPP